MVAVVVVTDSRSNKVYVYTECYRQASIIRHAQSRHRLLRKCGRMDSLGEGPNDHDHAQ